MSAVEPLETEARAVAALAFLVQQVRAGDFRDPLGRRARDLMAYLYAEDFLAEIGVDPDEAQPTSPPSGA